MKKYELTDQTIQIDGKTLYRIRALRDFDNVDTGNLGGYIESEKNLSHDGDCWVSGDAMVYGNASVHGNAQVYGDTLVYGDALVFGNAEVNQTYTSVTRSDGHTFIYVPCSDGVKRVLAGCWYFTMEEARDHWSKTRGGTPLDDETLGILDLLEKGHSWLP